MEAQHQRIEQALLDATLALSPSAAFVTDVDGRCDAVNARWCELMGAPSEAALGDGWMSLVHPEDRAGFVGSWWAALQGTDNWDCRCRVQRPDGTEAVVRSIAVPVLDASGATVAWIGQVGLDADGDEAWVAARSMRGHSRFEQAFDRSPIGMALTTLDGEYVRVNQAMCDLLGRTSDEMLNTAVLDTTHPDDLDETVAAAVELLDGTTPSFSLEKRFVSSSGLPVWTRATTTLLRDHDGVPRHFLTQVEDIEERRQLMAQLHQAAIHDPLTQLANRAGLDEYAGTLEPATTIGVIAIDLDRFKAVNDTEGHTAGDEVLRTVADRIVATVRSSDHAARTGGDEFTVVCADPGSQQTLVAMANRLVGSISEPIELGTTEVTVGASVGIAIGPAHELTQLRIHADEASYRAKRGGGAFVEVAATHA